MHVCVCAFVRSCVRACIHSPSKGQNNNNYMMTEMLLKHDDIDKKKYYKQQ